MVQHKAAIDPKLTDYDYSRVQGHMLSLCAIRKMYRTNLPHTAKQRLPIPGIEKGREDVIVAGTLIVMRTMEQFGFDTCTVSDSGLLEGLLLSPY